MIADLAALTDRAENRPLGYPSRVKPRPERLHRTTRAAADDGDGDALPLLIGLAPANRHPQAILGFLKVSNIERDQFGASEGATKAQQQERAVPQALEAFGRRAGHVAHDLGDGGGFAG